MFKSISKEVDDELDIKLASIDAIFEAELSAIDANYDTTTRLEHAISVKYDARRDAIDVKYDAKADARATAKINKSVREIAYVESRMYLNAVHKCDNGVAFFLSRCMNSVYDNDS
jgi:hypothetical protein